MLADAPREGVHTFVGKCPGMGGFADELNLLGYRPIGRAPHRYFLALEQGTCMSHHSHVDIVKRTEPYHLRLTAQVADFTLLTQLLSELYLNIFLSGHCHEGYSS